MHSLSGLSGSLRKTFKKSISQSKEKGLKVLDLIPRAQLETWIRQRAM